MRLKKFHQQFEYYSIMLFVIKREDRQYYLVLVLDKFKEHSKPSHFLFPFPWEKL